MRVGVVVLAGGVGSRLKHPHPKGCYPISPVRHKSLFQRLAERIVYAHRQRGDAIPVAIMTSHATHEATVHFWQEHAMWGLQPDQVRFFCQKDLPLLPDGPPAPDGNGKLFDRLIESGIYEHWKAAGVEYVTSLSIDNPLIDPVCPALLQCHRDAGNDVSLVGVPLTAPDEHVGHVMAHEGGLRVVEYSERGDKVGMAANAAFFCWSMPFIERIYGVDLPLHIAEKPPYRKQEYFVFDLLAYARKASCLVLPREECFAPLKHPDSVAAVQAALLQRDRAVWKALTGVEPPADRIFELSMAFHYPTDALRGQWHNKPLPAYDYVEEVYPS